MIRAVFDTNLLVSAFLSRDNARGVSSELLRLAKEGSVELYLSAEIMAETLATLVSSERARRRYDYTPRMAIQYCAELLAAPMIRRVEDRGEHLVGLLQSFAVYAVGFVVRPIGAAIFGTTAIASAARQR